MSGIGIVVIGRNEGRRLLACLESVREAPGPIVYVDSGSTDGSPCEARAQGVAAIELDPSRPFSAARARNEGFRHLRDAESIPFVQFTDGDCELREGWLREGSEALASDPHLAIVCGRLRERRPGASIYNRLCDMEWDGPTGEIESCGGVFMIRAEAFEAVGGFDASLIAGEEPDLCARLRRGGWRIRRLPVEMATHDASMTHFGEWWRRAVRGGHAVAEGAWRHARHGDRRDLRRIASAITWTVGIPVAVLLAAIFLHPWALAALLLYPAQWLRIRGRLRRSRPARDANLGAAFTFIAKFAALGGMGRFLFARLARRPSRIIEHRAAGAASPASEVAPPAQPASSMLYVGGFLPSRSETFVYREVFALRRRDVDVRVASVHEPDRGLGDAALESLADEVIPIYGSGPARLLFDALAEAAAHPARAARTLATILHDALTGEDVPARRRPRLVWQGLAGLALARRVRGEDVAHIHAHMAHVPTSIAMYAAQQLGVSFSFTGHAADLFAHRALLGRKMARAAFVGCISRWHRELYQSICRRTPDAYPIVRCGVDVTEFRPEPAAAGAAPMILSVARLVPKKGLDLLIEALAELQRHDERFEAVIVGDGPQREALRAMAARAGVEHSVSFPGALPNHAIRDLMRRADLFVLPCRTDERGDRDGIPVVLMEAMASGVPVVVGDLPAIRELVIHDETGVLIDVHAPGRLEAAIRELLHDEARRASLGRAGRNWVCEEFSQEVNIERLRRAFAGLHGPLPEAAVSYGS